MAEESPDSPRALAALYKAQRTLGEALMLFDEIDRTAVWSRIREFESELSQRLLTYFHNSENADSFLVRGFLVKTNLDGEWEFQFPAYEPDFRTEEVGHEAILKLPQHFISSYWAETGWAPTKSSKAEKTVLRHLD